MKRLVLLKVILLCFTGLATQAWSQSNDLHPVEDQPLARDFELTDINDGVHRLADYRGKIMIVNFWATWCPPCRFELPSMERLWQKLKKEEVIMLGINVGEDADTIFTFTADYPVSFPLLMDRDSSVTKMYKVLGIPTSFIIDQEGRIVYRAVGTREWDEDLLIKKILELNKTGK